MESLVLSLMGVGSRQEDFQKGDNFWLGPWRMNRSLPERVEGLKSRERAWKIYKHMVYEKTCSIAVCVEGRAGCQGSRRGKGRQGPEQVKLWMSWSLDFILRMKPWKFLIREYVIRVAFGRRPGGWLEERIEEVSYTRLDLSGSWQTL